MKIDANTTKGPMAALERIELGDGEIEKLGWSKKEIKEYKSDMKIVLNALKLGVTAYALGYRAGAASYQPEEPYRSAY